MCEQLLPKVIAVRLGVTVSLEICVHNCPGSPGEGD